VAILKKAWPDGRTSLKLEPEAFLRKLAGIVAPPRAHLVRYSGVFAPNAGERAEVVPAAEATEKDEQEGEGRRRGGRLPWSELLRRVFKFDVLECPCGGRRRVIAFITEPEVVKDILVAVHLPSAVPEVERARAPPQCELGEWPALEAEVPFEDYGVDEVPENEEGQDL
jgi:hypothetical protein